MVYVVAYLVSTTSQTCATITATSPTRTLIGSLFFFLKKKTCHSSLLVRRLPLSKMRTCWLVPFDIAGAGRVGRVVEFPLSPHYRDDSTCGYYSYSCVSRTTTQGDERLCSTGLVRMDWDQGYFRRMRWTIHPSMGTSRLRRCR